MARHPAIPELYTLIRDQRAREELAENVGSSPDYLWQVATGRRRASPDLAKEIERATKRRIPKELLIFGARACSKTKRKAA